MSRIQSILFDRDEWTKYGIEIWLSHHNMYPIKPIHTTQHFYRARLHDPSEFRRFVTKVVPHEGIEFIIGFY